MSVGVDIETLYAMDGSALTLRVQGERETISLTFTGAIVGRLFTRWGPGFDREGELTLPLTATPQGRIPDHSGDVDQVCQGALGGLIVRIITPDGRIERELHGFLGPDEFDLHPAGPGNTDGWPADRVDGHGGGCAVAEGDGVSGIAVSDGHGDLSGGRQPGADAESPGGETCPAAEREAGL